MKAVRGKGSEERGRVLWDATSRGLCHTVESDPAHNKVWQMPVTRNLLRVSICMYVYYCRTYEKASQLVVSTRAADVQPSPWEKLSQWEIPHGTVLSAAVRLPHLGEYLDY